jgi:AcrR family transcriptional regulator
MSGVESEARNGLERLRASALKCFVNRGYFGTSMRDIAQGAGLSVAALYHHLPGKQALLVSMLDKVMDDLYVECSTAIAAAQPGVGHQLTALVKAHVVFHARRRGECFVATSELRALEPENRERYIQMRDRQQRLFDDIVLSGHQLGAFSVKYPLETSRALVTMCTYVAFWFRPDGPLSETEVSEHYVTMALDLVRYRPELDVAPRPTEAASQGDGRVQAPDVERSSAQ